MNWNLINQSMEWFGTQWWSLPLLLILLLSIIWWERRNGCLFDSHNER